MSKNLDFIGDSSSLEIIQPDERMIFNSVDSISKLEVSKDQDLSYSKDESSLSFFIEEEKKSVLIESIKQYVPIQKEISNDPPRRVRKEIFEKYKPMAKVMQNEKKAQTQGYDIIQEFDKIFTKMETPKSNKIIQFQHNQQSKEKSQSASQSGIRKNLFLKKQPKQFEAEDREYTSSQIIATNEGVLKNLNGFNQVERAESAEKFNLSQIGNRVSLIQRQQSIEFSKDSDELVEILSSEIFHSNEKQFQYFPIQKNEPQQYPHNQTLKIQSKINIKIEGDDRYSSSPQSITMNSIQRTQRKLNQKKQQIDQNLQQSRFSDVYQRIELSQSTVNPDFMSRNTGRINIFSNNFLGNQISESKIFKKSASNGFLPFQEDQTLIHGLTSERIIEQAAEDHRIPLFLRKAVKANSIIPNFGEQRVRQNAGGQNNKLQNLVQSFSDSLSFLQKILQSLKMQERNIEKIKEAFKYGMTVQNFCTLRWNTIKEEDIQLLRPRNNFLAREWPVSKVYKALESYRKIVDGHKGIHINLNDERGVKKYLEIREKYIQIQKNILLISEDIYTRIKCLEVPKHYNIVREILKSQLILLKRRELEKVKRDLQQLEKLRLKNDELCRSEVGEHVIKKIENSIKFNLTLY